MKKLEIIERATRIYEENLHHSILLAITSCAKRGIPLETRIYSRIG